MPNRSARVGALALLCALSLGTAGHAAAQDTTRRAPDTTRPRPDDSARATIEHTPARAVDSGRAAPLKSADGVTDTSRPHAAADSASATKADTPASKPTKRKRRARRHRAASDSAEANAPLAWPVTPPPALPGSILPAKRIVAFYGNPFSKHMGILGAIPPDRMLAKLDSEVHAWEKADSTTPVQPALQLIAVVAQAGPGRDGKYRLRMSDEMIERVYSWAQKSNALLFLDVQVGKSTLQEELPRLIPYLKRPNVHLAIDPEFSMKHGQAPGKVIGTFDAADVNYASSLLDSLVTADSLPPKVLVVHRFTRPMLTHAEDIKLDPRTQIVIDMDGWGPPSLKRGSYKAYIYRHPVEYTGFKLFYHNDTKSGTKLMSPKQVLELFPKPLYIQYQ